MKKFTIMLSALLAFGSLQSFAQDAQADPQAEKPSTKSEFNGTGYYRLRNAETGRYLKVYGNVFDVTFNENVAIFNTGSSIFPYGYIPSTYALINDACDKGFFAFSMSAFVS